MKKAILTTLAAAASLAAAVPALAQPYAAPTHIVVGVASPPHIIVRPAPPRIVDVRFAPDLQQRVSMLSQRVDQEQSRGIIGWRAAQIMRSELGEVRREISFDRFRNGGYLSGWQRMRLNESLNRVAAQLRF
jgi:hypothetical protein